MIGGAGGGHQARLTEEGSDARWVASRKSQEEDYKVDLVSFRQENERWYKTVRNV